MPSGSLLPPESLGSRRTGFFRVGLAAELTLFRKPQVMLAALAIIFVPSLYVLIYVSSMWDPYGNLPQLPAAFVNQDVPVMRAGREINVGREVVQTLEKQKPFAFARYDTPEAARAAVRAGKAFFALLIPADFSRASMETDEPARLDIYVSEGGNFTVSLISKRFGSELAHTINETIARERWAALVGEAGKSEDPTLRDGLVALQQGARQLAEGAAQVHAGSVQMRDGVGRAEAGAGKLAEGTAQIAEGSARLTGGMKQVATAVTTIRAKLPPDRQLKELAEGSQALTRGTGELKQGLEQLDQAVPRLDAGAGQLQEGAAKVPFAGGKLAAGTGQLRAGIATFGEGVSRASKGAAEIDAGMNRLNPALQPLATGLVALNAGLATLGEKLPPTDQLDLLDRSMGQLREGSATLSGGLGELKEGAGQLEAGTRAVRDGSNKIAAGLDEVAGRFAAGFGDAHAAKLAAPVTVHVETTAAVPYNGPALAPYFAALSLWVGALMMSFVFFFRRLPDSMHFAPRPTKWLAKTLPLLLLGALQATVVVGVCGTVMGIHFTQPLLVWFVAALGSVTFVSTVMLFMSVLGDAGRLLAVILLILQLASSGGIYPVELSPSFYQTVHGFLPFTLLVRLFRVTMFSAFEGRWGGPAGELAIFAVGAMLLGTLLARWKHVPSESYGPAVEF